MLSFVSVVIVKKKPKILIRVKTVSKDEQPILFLAFTPANLSTNEKNSLKKKQDAGKRTHFISPIYNSSIQLTETANV